MDKRQKGKVKFFNDARGFGFIVPDDGSPDLFFHVTNLPEDVESNLNDAVEYAVGEDRNGSRRRSKSPSASRRCKSRGGVVARYYLINVPFIHW